MFNRYLGKPEETKKAFTEDGWFITGDCAKKMKYGAFQILGRLS